MSATKARGEDPRSDAVLDCPSTTKRLLKRRLTARNAVRQVSPPASRSPASTPAMAGSVRSGLKTRSSSLGVHDSTRAVKRLSRLSSARPLLARAPLSAASPLPQAHRRERNTQRQLERSEVSHTERPTEQPLCASLILQLVVVNVQLRAASRVYLRVTEPKTRVVAIPLILLLTCCPCYRIRDPNLIAASAVTREFEPSCC